LNEHLFVKSPSMHSVMSLVARAASNRAGALICGEDGSGRRVFARAIHARQAKSSAPFLVVDCAAPEGTNLELLIFGCETHENTSTQKAGDARSLERLGPGNLVERANLGTLYLQNLAEASDRVQSRLARLLRDREAILSASGETIVLDVRPIAGVDSSVDECVRDGRIREDLFRRLTSWRIEIPALRQRRDDIVPLAQHLVQEICARLHVSAKSLSTSSQMLMTALPWRGNGDELRRLLETVVPTLNGSSIIGIEDLLGQLTLDGGPATTAKGGGTLRQARARFEKEYIAAVVAQHRGRISDAAKTLGIQRTNLYRKMRALHVDRIKKDTNPIGS
jgi:DNA-binding NtrC family response regulator